MGARGGERERGPTDETHEGGKTSERGERARKKGERENKRDRERGAKHVGRPLRRKQLQILL